MTFKTPTEEQKKALSAVDDTEKVLLDMCNSVGYLHDSKRRAALAKTNLEQGFMWLRKAIMKSDGEN
nr:MAG: hypothetical protein [Bacteriophage sp.]